MAARPLRLWYSLLLAAVVIPAARRHMKALSTRHVVSTVGSDTTTLCHWSIAALARPGTAGRLTASGAGRRGVAG
jgi:hypothetical protein